MSVPLPRSGLIIPVVITVYEDRTFSFICKVPPMAELIKKAINLEKGSGVPNRDKVGKISRAKIKEIAAQKIAGPQCGKPGGGHAHGARAPPAAWALL